MIASKMIPYCLNITKGECPECEVSLIGTIPRICDGQTTLDYECVCLNCGEVL